jgi:hypothetical protein
MKKIYLILSNPTDYESHPAVEGFVSTSDEALIVTEKLKSQYKFAREFMDTNIARAELQFRTINPDSYLTSLYSDLRLEDIPKWPSGISQKDITPEMISRNEMKFVYRMLLWLPENIARLNGNTFNLKLIK